jgi:hypothetical protein
MKAFLLLSELFFGRLEGKFLATYLSTNLVRQLRKPMTALNAMPIDLSQRCVVPRLTQDNAEIAVTLRTPTA